MFEVKGIACSIVMSTEVIVLFLFRRFREHWIMKQIVVFTFVVFLILSLTNER